MLLKPDLDRANKYEFASFAFIEASCSLDRSGSRLNWTCNNLSYILIINILIYLLWRFFSHSVYLFFFRLTSGNLTRRSWNRPGCWGALCSTKLRRQLMYRSCICSNSNVLPRAKKDKRDQLRYAFNTFQKFVASDRYNCTWRNVLYILTWFFISFCKLDFIYILDNENPFKKCLIKKNFLNRSC